jgi:hypothetical protein
MTQIARSELKSLLKRAEEQRRKIKALQTELELLNQRIARAQSASGSGRERRQAPRKK